MKKYILLIGLAYFKVFIASGQDPFFSQFFVSPMTINPALIGNDLVKSTRVQSNARNQWWGGTSLPYSTKTIQIERRLNSRNSENNEIVLGLMFLNERSNGGILSNTFFSGAVNVKKKLDEKGNSIISGALSCSYNNRMIDLSNATFQSQFGSFGFIRTASNYDPISTFNLNSKYIDFNAGLNYEKKSQKFDFNIGGTLFHVGKPDEGFAPNGKYPIDFRKVITSSIKYRSEKNKEVEFLANFQNQNKSSLLTYGTTYSLIFDEIKGSKLTYGLFHRVNESIYPYVGIKYNGMNLGFSHDIITGSAKTSFNTVQSFELSLGYVFGN